jgi:hypothetical protein
LQDQQDILMGLDLINKTDGIKESYSKCTDRIILYRKDQEDIKY